MSQRRAEIAAASIGNEKSRNRRLEASSARAAEAMKYHLVLYLQGWRACEKALSEAINDITGRP